MKASVCCAYGRLVYLLEPFRATIHIYGDEGGGLLRCVVLGVGGGCFSVIFGLMFYGNSGIDLCVLYVL